MLKLTGCRFPASYLAYRHQSGIKLLIMLYECLEVTYFGSWFSHTSLSRQSSFACESLIPLKIKFTQTEFKV